MRNPDRKPDHQKLRSALCDLYDVIRGSAILVHSTGCFCATGLLAAVGAERTHALPATNEIRVGNVTDAEIWGSGMASDLHMHMPSVHM